MPLAPGEGRTRNPEDMVTELNPVAGGGQHVSDNVYAFVEDELFLIPFNLP